jgi:hypothetical protein
MPFFITQLNGAAEHRARHQNVHSLLNLERGQQMKTPHGSSHANPVVEKTVAPSETCLLKAPSSSLPNRLAL